MGLTRLLERRQYGPADDFWYGTIMADTASGVDVTPETATNVSAWYCGIQVISAAFAAAPLKLYRRVGNRNNRELATDHPLYRLLKLKPNSWLTSFEWREMQMGHILTRGNGYNQVVRDKLGNVRMLVPLHPGRVEPKDTGVQIVYEFTRSDGTKRRFPAEQILHFRGLSPNGLVGYSPVTLARESIGSSIAAQRHEGSMYRNSARPSGIATIPRGMSETAKENVKKSIRGSTVGDNYMGVMLFEDGMSWTQIGFSNEDAQFIETRGFHVQEAARWLNISPHKLKDLSRATFSNIEHLDLEFLTDTMRPWFGRAEERLAVTLLTEQEQETLFFRFQMEDLLRADSAARAEFYTKMSGIGVYSINDIREKEDLPPVPGGDERFVPLNMVPLDMARQAAEPAPAPAPAALPEPAPPDQQAQRSLPPVEQRSARSMAARRRHRKTFARTFGEIGGRVVRAEVAQVRAAVKKAFKQRDAAELRTWLDDFYAKHPRTVARAFSATLLAYAEAVSMEAAGEVGVEPDKAPAMKKFARDYARILGVREAKSSLNQLRQILKDTDPEEVEAALNQRLDEWDGGRKLSGDKRGPTRADKLGRRESVQAEGAFTKAAYVALSVRQIRWVSSPGCEICSPLNGMVVGVEAFFVDKGSTVSPDGDTAPFQAPRSVGHPPLHRGCKCMIAAD